MINYAAYETRERLTLLKSPHPSLLRGHVRVGEAVRVAMSARDF
ncbi:hypothetical protein ACFXKC_51820 [Streptomyces sp. NPDC059340]